jgi:hypothetical protein
MNHRMGINRAVPIMIAALCLAGATTLRAQQASRLSQTAAGAVTEGSSPSISWLGPRLPLEARPLAPSLAGTTPSPLFDGGDNHTFEFSTLALVLIGGLALLLVLR